MINEPTLKKKTYLKYLIKLKKLPKNLKQKNEKKIKKSMFLINKRIFF